MNKLILFLFCLYFSCNEKNSNAIRWNDSDVFCGRAEITKIIGNDEYFGGGSDVIIKCVVDYNGSNFQSELIIETSVIGKKYSPFKVGDIVVAKFLKANKKKTVEMFLLESINSTTGYKWESIYTLEEACSGNWPEGSRQQKEFSARGKL